MTKLNEFIASVRSGVAKNTHFEVELTLPRALANREPIKSNMRKVILFCDQTQIPGISFGTNQVRSYGEFREVPYEKLYEQVQLSFYVDTDMHVKALFDNWADLIQSPNTRDFSYYNNYTTDQVRIVVHDSMENHKYMCTLHKVYPKAIAPIQLDYASKDIMKLQVTFAYEYATFAQLGGSTNPNAMFVPSVMGSQINDFNYGYNVQQFAEIPNEYFNNFSAFQQDVLNQDLTIGGVKTSLSLEDVGVKTGFGGIFI